MISRQGCPVSGGPCRYQGLTQLTQFHVTLYTRARARASRKVTTTCVRCVRRCAKARGPISATQPENRLQTRASMEFSILAVFRLAGVQTCEPGTHPGSHLPHSPAFAHRPALTQHSARWPTSPGANRKPCKPCFLARRWRDAALSPPVLDFRQEGPVLPVVVDGVANRDLIHAREVSIPNAHPLFREETPGSRECVDFIGF